MGQLNWVVLSYQVPANPSKKRVYVWRKLKDFGAIYFRQGVAMLPKNPGNINRFKGLSKKIVEMGGECTMAELKYLDKNEDIRAVAEFREQSAKEYKKIIKEIRTLEKEMDKDHTKKEEYTKKAENLGRKLEDIRQRDYFMQYSQPETLNGFEELFKDMTMATVVLGEQIAEFMKER